LNGTIAGAQNIAKHGVPFDTRREYNEERRLTLGKVEGRLFVVAYTRRDNFIRIISARKANEREQRQYDETLSA
jgi:uncharacterized protein